MPSIIELFYRESDLETYNNIQNTNLYSNVTFDNIVGNAIYQINSVEKYDGQKFNTFDIEYSIFYLNNNEDTIFFNIAIYNKSTRNRLHNETFHTFQILGGSGKYNGATGNVYYYVDKNAIRNVKVVIN